MKHRPHRHAYRLPIERIAATAAQDHRIGAQAGADADQRAKVVRIGDLRTDDQRHALAPLPRQLVQCRPRPPHAHGHHSRVEAETDDAVDHVGRRCKDQHAGRNQRRDLLHAAIGQQNRLHRPVAGQQPPHDQLALGDEPAALAGQFAVLEIAVCRHTRVIQRLHGDDVALGHAEAPVSIVPRRCGNAVRAVEYYSSTRRRP